MNKHLNRLRSDEFEVIDIDDRADSRVNRQSRPTLMVSFRKKDGTTTAFSYSHLYRVECDPSRVIKLHFTEHEVQLFGSQLERLYDHLLRHTQMEVAEVDPLHAENKFEDGHVGRIEIRQVE